MRATYLSRKILLITGLALVVFGLIVSGVTRGDVNSAIQYLKDKNDNPWVTMALISADEDPDLDYLKSVPTEKAIDIEAPILAITAARKDPRVFSDENLVAKLKGFYDGTQIGAADLLNDDIFGILALVAAGEDSGNKIIQGAKNFILENQNEDGGWSWSESGDSSVDMTAMGIMALKSIGMSESDPAIQKAVQYLKGVQNEDGGFPSVLGEASNTSATAWTLSAMRILGENWTKGENTPESFLASIQDSSGYFPNMEGGAETGFTKIETAYAVIALAGKSYPLNIITPIKLANVYYRIEGSRELLCSGETRAPNALALVKIVAAECGFDYTIEKLSFGPYLERIGDDEAEGLAGWLYRVNYESPNVGAGDYNLKDGDRVLWYYGEFEWPPLKTALNKNELADEEELVVTVEAREENDWKTLPEADVFLGSLKETTDQNGQVVVSLPAGAYRVFAEKAGYVRSAKTLVTAGDKAEATVSLKAVVGEPNNSAGAAGGSSVNSGQAGTISFVLNTASLDFGAVNLGGNYSDIVSITNKGQVPIYVESIVSGDDLFRNYLKINSGPWRNFSTTIDQNKKEDVDIGLTVPGDYDRFGTKSGNLIFWAIQNQ